MAAAHKDVSSPSGTAIPLKAWQRAGIALFFVVLLAFAVPVEMRSALMSRRMGDLDCFLRAAWAVRSGADLYAVTDDNGFHYNYPPLLAILATPLADPPHKDLAVSAARTVGLLGSSSGNPLAAASALGADETPLVPDHPPTVPFLPFAVAVAVVYFFNLFCLAFAVHLLAVVLDPAPASRFRWWSLRIWPILVCVIPIGHTLMRGQANLLVLALLAGAVADVARGRSFRAGLWLAGAACLKIFPAFLFLWPLWRRDGRCLAGGAAGFVLGLLLVPLVALGPARTGHCYARLGNVLVLPGLGAGGDDSRADELTTVNAAADNQSLLAVLHNTLHRDLATRPVQASAALRGTSYLLGGLLTLLTLTAAGWRRSHDPVSVTLFLGLLIVDMVLLCPVCHLHYFALAVPLIAALVAARWPPTGDRVAIGASLTVLFVFNAVAYLVPHLPHAERLREGGLATFAVLLLWTAGALVLFQRRRARNTTRDNEDERTETLWQRLFHGVRRVRQQSRWQQFAGPQWEEQIMSVPVTDRFHAKQGRTIARWSLEDRDQRLVVYLKRHYRLPWWHGLLALLWPNACWSPALQEWKHLQWAKRKGLPVPEAVAGGEYIGPWGRFQSFLAVEELTGMLALHEAVPLAAARLDPVSFRRWKDGLIREMVSITLDLHRRRWFHKDLYLCHFYVAEADTGCVPDWSGRVYLIDLHRLSRHRFTWLWRRTKDLGQLLYSSDVAGVTLRDRLHFWRTYLAADPLGGAAARWLFWCIRVQAWNYRRRSRRRKSSLAA